jgi:hypothetical protein
MPTLARPSVLRPSLRRVLLALVLLGAALRLWQWGAEGSLWVDEISLSRNILSRSVGELVRYPLAFDQVAPVGFLAAVKLSTLAFGGGERALWLVPLLGGLAGLLLFRRLAERALRGAAVPLAMALFALALAMIRYSAEVKQYGLDATAAVGLTLLALDLRTRDRSVGRLVLAGGAGLIVIWFSQASVIVMAGLGAALAAAWLIERDRRTLRVLLVTVPIWAAASLMALLLGNRSMTPATRAFMNDFWSGGFLPMPPRLSTAAPWFWQRLPELFSDPWTLRYPVAWIFALLAVVGIAVLWRQRRDSALLIAAPFVMTLIAAIAQQYPFRTRLVVFLVPSAILAAAAGAGWIADAAGRRSKLARAIVIVAVLIPPLLAIADARLPSRVDNYRPAYAHLQANRRPGDAVYMSFLANSSAIYYGPRYGLHPGQYHLGACDRTDTRAYLRDFDRFRGHSRVWVLAKNGPAVRVPHEAIHRYLNTIGVLRDSRIVHSGVTDPVTLELYDLSDPARLRAASAETIAVAPMPEYPKPGCRDWSGDAGLIAHRPG